MINTILKSRVEEDICVQLQPENHARKYLCDCGYASDITVADCHDIEAIFVSHTHIDHFIGFNLIVRHQLAIGRRVVVCGPQGIAASVQAQLLSFNWNLLKVDEKAVWYEVREIHGGNQIQVYELRSPEWKLQKVRSYQSEIVFENEALIVRYTALFHGIDTIAYLFSEPDKLKIQTENLPYPAGKWIKLLKNAYLTAQEDIAIEINASLSVKAKDLFHLLQLECGYKVGYIMDHRASEENHEKICRLFANADEVYIEAYYREEERTLADKNNHSTAQQSGLVAKRANIRKVIPVHFSRRYHQFDERAALLTECFEAFEKPILDNYKNE